MLPQVYSTTGETPVTCEFWRCSIQDTAVKPNTPPCCRPKNETEKERKKRKEEKRKEKKKRKSR
jgi:hypothetical protein